VLARLMLLAALLPAACAAGEGVLPPPDAGPRTSALYWLARADEAEARGDAEEALRALEQWVAEQPMRADLAHWERRLRLASAAGDVAAVQQACVAVLAASRDLDEEQRFRVAELVAEHGDARAAATAFDGEFSDPVLRLRALRRRAAALEADGSWADAAATLELAAADAGAGAAARGWWEHASWLWERAGDRARATRAIERALVGVALGPREEAALARLRAFELGEIASVADARAALRFHDDPELRLTAARSLARQRFADEIATFGSALGDPDGRVVAVALAQLQERFTPSERAYAASCARGLLTDPRAEVRLPALTLLGASGAAGDAPALIEALAPEDRAQFRVARTALERLCGRAEPAPLDPDLAGRQALRAAWLAWWKARGANP
jgi:hypothetical protein